jgi:pyruvate-formate lyase-activating enzyme
MLFNIDQVRVLHIEPTTVCNASCPQCHREDTRFYLHDRDKSEINLAQIKSLFGNSFIAQLDKMFMCGNFGEPAAAKDTLEIYKYFRQHNSDITLGMNTNGSLRNTDWWKDLAIIFNQPFDYVVFSIDGLSDTNSIYRQNTNWDKILENAQVFISQGGSAHWDMLVYEHNEHQVKQCEQLAKDLGFSWFRAKVSKRFYESPVKFLNPPQGYVLPNVNSSGAIECHALKEQSIYVAANGHIMPCCWFGAEAFTLDSQAQNLLSDWNKNLVSSWKSSPHRICSNTCVQDNTGTSFTRQWQIERQLR